MNLRKALFVSITIFVGVGVSQAAVINVPGGFGTIQGAIADASTVNGDEIVVAPGTYLESINFLGKGITVRSASGDPTDTIIDGMGFFHVVQCINNEDPNTVLEGFTIRRGEASGGAYPDDIGGGMYNLNSSPTVTNCIFSDNHAKESGLGAGGHGGGMYNDTSGPILTDCMFELNSAEGNGGGMYNVFSNLTLTNCTFSVNTSDIGISGGEGGGMYNDYSNSTITGCTFIGNTTDFGGGILNSHSSSVVTDCIFSQNTVDSIGGGMYNRYDSSPTVTNCTFSNNSALVNGGGMTNYMDSNPTVTDCTFSGNISGNGGGMYNSSNTATVTNCLFSSNIATISGGGMVNYGSDTIINQCKFIGNTAVSGGGIRNEFRASPFVTNCIFSHNIVSDGKGGGMSNYYECNPVVANCTFSENEMTDNPTSGGGLSNELTSSPTVTNSIFWGNVPVLDQVSYDGTSIRHISYSLVQGGSTGLGNIDVDPAFVDATYDDLHLQGISLAIDAGSNSILGGFFDLDGNARVIDMPGVGARSGPIVDMGAYESGTYVCLCGNGLVGDINCDDVVDLLDLAFMAMHWLETI